MSPFLLKMIMISQYIHIYLLAAVIGLYEFIEYRNLVQIFGIIVVGLLMHCFIAIDSIWLCFIIWELLSIASALLTMRLYDGGKNSFLFILGSGLLSGACFLAAILDMPYNASFVAADFSKTSAQIFLALAICIKSGCFPFIWPQIASTGPVTVSAFLHGATVIHLGTYLACKLNFAKYTLMSQICSGFGVVTIGWAFIHLMISKDLKKHIACLTQVYVVMCLSKLGSEVAPILVCQAIFVHGFYKSALFLLYDKVINQRKISLWTITLLVLTLFWAGGIFGLATQEAVRQIHIILQAFSIYTLVQMVFYCYRICGKYRFNLQHAIPVIILMPFMKVHPVSLLISSTMILISYCINELPLDRVILWCSKLPNRILPELIWWVDYFAISLIKCFIWTEFTASNLFFIFKDLDYMNLITMIPILAGIYLLSTRQSKYDVIAGLNLVGIAVAFIFLRYGGIEIASTQILADLIITIFLIQRRDLEVCKLSYSGQKLITSIDIGISVLLIHPGINPALIFPSSGHLNPINEIVVNWRLIDTFGEMLVFYAAGLCVKYI